MWKRSPQERALAYYVGGDVRDAESGSRYDDCQRRPATHAETTGRDKSDQLGAHATRLIEQDIGQQAEMDAMLDIYKLTTWSFFLMLAL